MNTITYTLENGTKIVQPINKECFVNHKGNPVSEATLHQLFSDTAWIKELSNTLLILKQMNQLQQKKKFISLKMREK